MAGGRATSNVHSKLDKTFLRRKLTNSLSPVPTDCDGVLFLHNTVISGANVFINFKSSCFAAFAVNLFGLRSDPLQQIGTNQKF